VGAQAPEVPEAKDSFIVRERAARFFGDFRAVDLLGLSDSEKGRFPATSLEML
jgi:hypothetical protein